MLRMTWKVKFPSIFLSHLLNSTVGGIIYHFFNADLDEKDLGIGLKTLFKALYWRQDSLYFLMLNCKEIYDMA